MRRLISTSATLRNKCRLSITTFVRGMDWKSGGWLTLKLFFLCDDNEVLSSTVRERDHFVSGSHLSSDEHLHQMQEYFEAALSIPEKGSIVRTDQ